VDFVWCQRELVASTARDLLSSGSGRDPHPQRRALKQAGDGLALTPELLLVSFLPIFDLERLQDLSAAGAQMRGRGAGKGREGDSLSLSLEPLRSLLLAHSLLPPIAPSFKFTPEPGAASEKRRRGRGVPLKGLWGETVAHVNLHQPIERIQREVSQERVALSGSLCDSLHSDFKDLSRDLVRQREESRQGRGRGGVLFFTLCLQIAEETSHTERMEEGWWDERLQQTTRSSSRSR
jgi:hypothetical protein